MKPEAHLRVNDAHALYHQAYSGAGLAVVPDFLAREDVAAGTMHYVLPEWDTAPMGVFAVWPPNAPKEGLTTFFVRYLAEGTG